VTFNRRETLILAGAATAASLTGIGAVSAAEGAVIDQAKLMTLPPGLTDHVLGDEAATVTVIEYASPTCPHCAAFSNEVYPEFKARYIDPGLVKFILRPFVRNVLDAVVFLIAEAAGPEQYHNVIETYFRTQATWSASQTPRDALLAVALELGFTEESFEAALTNQELFTAMDAAREQALNEFGLEGTPTFYVNGKTLGGEQSLAQLAAEIDPLLPAGTAPAADPAAPAEDAADPSEETSTPVQ
jgi:protein-disulfide isomerase